MSIINDKQIITVIIQLTALGKLEWKQRDPSDRSSDSETSGFEFAARVDGDTRLLYGKEAESGEGKIIFARGQGKTRRYGIEVPKVMASMIDDAIRASLNPPADWLVEALETLRDAP